MNLIENTASYIFVALDVVLWCCIVLICALKAENVGLVGEKNAQQMALAVSVWLIDHQCIKLTRGTSIKLESGAVCDKKLETDGDIFVTWFI